VIFQSIFVCSGIYPNNYLIEESCQEALALENYLYNGGNLYLEGGDVWFYDPHYQGGHDFGNYFGIYASSDGGSNIGPVGGEIGTFTSSMTFIYNGENRNIDHLEPVNSGFIILKDTDDLYNCGIANNTGTYNTVGTSFELAGLVDGTGNSTKEALLDSIMYFFGVGTSSVEELPIVDIQKKLLSAYPNPFRENIVISMFLPENSNSFLRIFDITGRLVKDFNILSSTSDQNISYTWDGRDNNGQRVRNGVYLIILDSDRDKTIKKIIAVE